MTDLPIRLATIADEAEILALCRELHAENGLFPMSDERVMQMLSTCFDRKGGIIGLVGAPGGVQAVMFLKLANHWYSEEWFLEELFSYVRPEHRKTTHAKRLVDWAKHMADDLGLPALIGIISLDRTEAKVRLYRRQLGNPAGAFFLYRPAACKLGVESPPRADWWREPKRVRAGAAAKH